MSDIFDKIRQLKKEKNAVILAHYYQDPDIQDIADFLGDSLALSQEAAKTNADVIVFAGVHFMAETAKILNPEKIVLLPDLNAGCSLADSCPINEFVAFKQKFPEHVVVSYINCSAAVKAVSDYICTSSNAVSVVNSIPKDKGIIFAPDKNLGRYVANKTGRELVLWNGACSVHESFSFKKLIQLKQNHPNAEILAHPECEENVLELADYIGSTSALLAHSASSNSREFIVVTESGIMHQMQKKSPEKKFIPAPPNSTCACNECPFMKSITIEKVATALEKLEPRIEVNAEIAALAMKPIQRMISV